MVSSEDPFLLTTHYSLFATRYSHSIRTKLVEPPVLGLDPPHGAGGGAHHHGLGFDREGLELDAAQHGAVGDAGGGEQTVAAHHVVHLVALARVLDAHLEGALALLLGVEHQAALHLAADAAQRRRRQHPFWRAADTHIDVYAGAGRIGGMN